MKKAHLLITVLSLLWLLPCGAAPLRGLVKDSADGSPVCYADVIVSDLADRVLSHTVTGEDGTFVTDVEGKAIITVRMVGYDAFVSVPMDISAATDMGTISLARSQEGLQEVRIIGEKNHIVYRLDRQRISASSSISASGGTVVDILSDTPSFLVDSDGGVTFRGSSNFLVYVDGKLSPLEGSAALQQIPAASVENVEILTTPSARYRTDGDGPIINITTKKSDAGGWSGMMHLSGTTLGGWSADGLLNFRTGRHNFYVGGTIETLKWRSDFNQTKITSAPESGTLDIIETQSVSDGKRWRDLSTRMGRAGWQFSRGRTHNLEVDFQAGQTENDRGGDMLYDEARRNLVTSSPPSKASYNAHDRYRLCKDLVQMSADYTFRPTDRSEFALTSRLRYDGYSIEYTESNLFDLSGARYEGTRGYEEEHHWDADGALAYKYRYADDGNLELGYQYSTYSEHGGYRINYWDRAAQDFVWQDDLATPFYYRRQIHSVYGMLTHSFGKLSFDAGLRADYVLDELEIEIAGADRDILRFDVFPSAHLSYDAAGAGTFSAGYSYRTNRPGIWNLEPYITYEDYYTKKMGNPDILPEYAHSAELGWRKSIGPGASLAVTLYGKYRRDISDWVRSALEPGVTLDRIVNAGNQTETGMEFNGSFRFTPWWNSTLGGSLFHYRFRSTDVSCTDAAGLHYFANWINAFTLTPGTKVQFDAHAVGPRILTQGSEKGYVYFNLSVRQSLLKDRMTVSFVGNDIFHTAKYSNSRTADSLVSVTMVRPVYPLITLSLSYNFNAQTKKTGSNAETELFEGKNF